MVYQQLDDISLILQYREFDSRLASLGTLFTGSVQVIQLNRTVLHASSQATQVVGTLNIHGVAFLDDQGFTRLEVRHKIGLFLTTWVYRYRRNNYIIPLG